MSVAATWQAPNASPARAADAAQFDPGNLISDAVFYDSTSMTSGQIQQFLDSLGSACVAGEQPCLRGFTSVTTTKTAESGLCQGFTGGLTKSAAQMIAEVATSCGINPRVLIVTLQKEQSLITASRPTAVQYRSAMGYGCPDTAPCDAQFYGFFNQVYQAARQFRLYQKYPTSYGHVAGRVNNIAFNPASNCGSAGVYIQNQATAGLYNYTPYQPNSSALGNLYGSGDGCATYGNRNFWRFFTDWFGSPSGGSSLMRTASNASVYLVTTNAKYPIPSLDTMNALYPLGSVAFVSDQYLAGKPTGRPLGRVILAPDGTVYFFDAGIRLPFLSCGMVEDYGSSCGAAVPVDQAQIALLAAGPVMTNVYTANTGKTFLVTKGMRSEVADSQSLAQRGISTSAVWLLETGIAALPLGTPVARDGLLLTARGGGGDTFVPVGQTTYQIPRPIADGMPAGAVLLDRASLDLMPAPQRVGPLVRRADTGQPLMMTPAGSYAVPESAAGQAPTVPPAVADLLPVAGALLEPVLMKAAGAGTVYWIQGGSRHTLTSWPDLLELTGGSATPVIVQVPGAVLDLIPAGAPYLHASDLLYGPAGGTVFMVDGPARLIPIPSFAVAAEFGRTAVAAVSAEIIASATVSTSVLGLLVTCSGVRYIASGGSLHPLTTYSATAVPGASLDLDPATCRNLSTSTVPLDRFIVTADSTVYLLENGLKRPITNVARYLALGGDQSNTLAVSGVVAATFSSGSSIS